MTIPLEAANRSQIDTFEDQLQLGPFQRSLLALTNRMEMLELELKLAADAIKIDLARKKLEQCARQYKKTPYGPKAEEELKKL